MKIRLLALDIDGVLTNGKAFIDTLNNEFKSINYRDLDAVTWLKEQGVIVVFLTGENTALVDTITRRFGISHVVKGAKDKKKAMEEISGSMQVSLGNICYVGDSDRDAGVLKMCGLSMAPQDATRKAKESAGVSLSAKGGDGVVHEVKEYLIENNHLVMKQ